MTDETTTQAQNAKKTATNGSGGTGGGSRSKKNPAATKAPTTTTGASTTTTGAPASTGSKGPARNNTAKKGSPGSAPAAKLASEDGISRPSSTDGQRKTTNNTNGSNRGRNNRGSGGRRGGQPNSARHTNSPKAASVSIPSSTAPGNGTESAALSSLQRVITDLRSFPTSNPPSAVTQAPAAPSATSASPSITSTLPINAPVFQPGAQVYPPPNVASESPRHRKAASAGNLPNPGFNASSFASPLNTFAPGLGSMPEDDGEEGALPDDEEQDSFPSQAVAPPARHIVQSSMGSFTAPRFAGLAGQHQHPPHLAHPSNPDPDHVGPTGRPQLAPGFMFGQRRSVSAAAGPAIGEEDVGFQFPQQQQQQQQQSILEAQSAQNAHRRTPSQLAGVSNLMAEQIAIQSQIEALQQQQQQLLQQQIATGTVMQSFASPQLGGRIPQAHRRIQSQQVPMGMGMPGFNGMGSFGLGGGVGLGLAPTGPDANKGHGRRHSVNVINKAGPQGGDFYNDNNADGYDDGFSMPAGSHSRQPSRAFGGGGGQNHLGDLAQAQAQLQSLQQFRAAAGGHHQKMASFSFPNMLPNMMAANMMGLGGFNFLQQQQQQFQMQLQQQNQPQRKSLFAPYLPQASLPPLLAAGKLVVGILRVNKRNRSDAYISTEVLDSDIYICGSKDRNRALEGDIVAVELLDVDEVWGTKKEKEEKKRKKEENAAYDPRGAANRKNDKKKDDVEVEGQGLMLFEDEEVTDEVKPQFAGHVVAVVERMPGQLFSGTLGLLRPSSAATKEKQDAERREREGDRAEESPAKTERPKIVWFKPTDKRVPLIAIPTEQAPADFVHNSEAYADRLFVACIKRHPISSLHPFGTLVEELGQIGDVEVETSALLKDCNFPTEDFSDNVLKGVPPVPWTIPEREFEIRKDLRDLRVFTIDPETAKDLDDAFSLQVNEDGTYDVHVHIADVAYFVKPNTPLDRDARKRATSVYLVQRAVPMLPPTLSEELCSLIPGRERLAFTVIFTMTKDARVLNKSYARTIIKSCAKLSYGHAQRVIDGLPFGDVDVSPEHEVGALEEDVRILKVLAGHLRERRFEAGALKLDSPRLQFTLDANGLPVDCSPYTTNHANTLVEEFMLLANMSAAQRIAVHLPEQAFLRRHEQPIDRRLAAFAERAKRMGYEMDISSANTVHQSIARIENTAHRQILEILATKPMQRAKYFCSGMLDIAKYGHYSLNTPLYTHFTSPIRRYADILVHRQLEAVLSNAPDVKFNMDRDAVAKVAQQCNMKKDSAKLAQEQSQHLFLCLLISDLTQRYGPVIRQATVVNVLDAAFDVLVPEFGIEKRVHVDQMPIDNHLFDQHTHTLQIYWSDKDVITWLAENSDDEHLKNVKRTAEQHAAKMEVNSFSVHDEKALFDEDEDEDEIIILDNSTKKEPVVETSKQRLLSASKPTPTFEGLRQSVGRSIQDIKELMTVPVIVTADLTKSPPVLKVYSVNPYSSKRN